MKTFEVTGKSRVDLEQRAIEIRRTFYRGDDYLLKPLDVERLIDNFLSTNYGWNLDVVEELPPSIEAFTDPKNQTINFDDETMEKLHFNDGRARFTACHEFSHVDQHGDQMLDRMVTMSESTDRLHREYREEIPTYKDPEWQANYMAGALLAPFEMVLNVLEVKDWDQFSAANELSEAAKMSLSAAKYRIKKVLELKSKGKIKRLPTESGSCKSRWRLQP